MYYLAGILTNTFYSCIVPHTFHYHAILLQGTVRYLLRKRQTNLKRPVDNDCKEEMERKKKCVDSLRPTPGDIANHLKQIMIELRKVDVNVDAVRKLQKLSFLQRADDISNIHGTDALTKILKNYPFLQLEEQVLYIVSNLLGYATGKKWPLHHS